MIIRFEERLAAVPAGVTVHIVGNVSAELRRYKHKFGQARGIARRLWGLAGAHTAMGKKSGPSQRRFPLPRVLGDPPLYGLTSPKNRIRQFSATNKSNPTNAEKRFRHILANLNGGVLRRRYRAQHPISGKWIVDFFSEIRLAIELDGEHHQHGEQAARDRTKERDCRRFDITLVRFSNVEVFGQP